MADAPLRATSAKPVSQDLIARAMGYAGQLVGSAAAGYRRGAQIPFNPSDPPRIPPNPALADPPPGGNVEDAFTPREFGPGRPIIADPARAFAMMGRTWDYLAGANLNYIPKGTQGIPYDMIRELSYSDYMLRYCINTREDQICALEWTIQKRQGSKQTQDRDAAAIEASWKVPGPKSHFGWTPFTRTLRRLLEDRLVIDAMTAIKWSTRSGGVYRVEWQDGATVHPLIDSQGKPPEPPLPARQIIIKGFPQVNLDLTQIIWDPRNVPPGELYGFGLVEQALTIVLMSLKRDAFMLNYFTQSNLPPAIYALPQTWTPQDVLAWADKFDSRMSGNLIERSKLGFMPGGPGTSFHELKGEVIKSPFDEWRARVYCALYSLPPGPFIAQVNKGTSRDQRDEALQEGLIPHAQSVEEFFDMVLSIFYGRPDFCFRFNLTQSSNPVAQAQADGMDLENGVLTLNDVMDRRGLPQIGPAGDVRRFKTQTGWVPLERIDDEPAPPAAHPLGPGGGAGGGNNTPRAREAATRDHGGDQRTGDDMGKSLDDPDPSSRIEILKGSKRRGPRFRPPANPQASGASGHLTPITHEHLRRAGAAAARHLASHVGSRKAKGGMSAGEIRKLVDSSDLSALHGLIRPYQEALHDVGVHQARENLRLLAEVRRKAAGSPDDILAADPRVLAYARDRSAEMVGMRRAADGSLVPNPNAEWRIDETTRMYLRRDLANALEEGVSPSDLVRQLEDSFNFSEYRARQIADTEISMANQQATLDAWDVSGQVAGKGWVLSEDHDAGKPDDCDANAADGIIGLRALFSSGVASAPAHPGCECGIEAELEAE